MNANHDLLDQANQLVEEGNYRSAIALLEQRRNDTMIMRWHSG